MLAIGSRWFIGCAKSSRSSPYEQSAPVHAASPASGTRTPAWPSSSACTKARAKARPMGTVGLAR